MSDDTAPKPGIPADFESRSRRFLKSPGKLGRLMLAHDWSKTPLGPISRWPQSLKTAVSLMLNSQHPMWIGWGPDATFLYNDAYIQVLSLAKHPWALGRPAAEVWAEIWDVCGPLADQVFLKGEAPFVEDVRLFMSRGDFLEETYFSFSYSPIRDESGNVGGLFCPNTDTTAKHLNARRLRTLSELAAKSLIEKSIESACATAAATLAANPDDIPFSLLYLIDHEKQTARLQQTTQLARAGLVSPESIDLAPDDAGCPWPVAQVMATRQARTVPIPDPAAFPSGLAGQQIRQATILPVTSPGQMLPIGVLIAGVQPACRLDDEYRTFFELVATQVAAAVQNAQAAEDERKKAELLAEIDRAKTAFFSNVSHEFRTPLTLMLGPIEDALSDRAQALPAGQRERLELVHRNALRLQKLVNTLLDFSRIQAGRAHAHFVPTDLAALTIDLASSFRSAMESAGLRLEVACAPLREPVYVDVAMWEKIVLNLLSNALKFTFEGGIRVAQHESEGQLLLTVSDTGVGISADELPRVFERFHRIDGARARTHEGSGIGLALVHDLVALHHGGISVDSEPGKGTTFRVRLPLGCAHLPPEHVGGAPAAEARQTIVPAFIAEAERWLPAAEKAAEKATEKAVAMAGLPGVVSAGLGSMRILVADDNADMRDYVRRLLEPHWDVELVANGREALAAIGRRHPDLILSDIMMPELDGFGLLAALRADEALRELPLILLSARAGEEARIEGLQAGADDYLVKPFSGRELLARIDSLLLRSRMRAIESHHARRMQTIFAQAPVAIAILRGPDHVFELANPLYLNIIGHRAAIGKPMREVLAESDGQGVIRALDQAYASGKSHVGHSVRLELRRGPRGALEECFFDYVYQPMFDARQRIEGIAIVCYEVTELAKARRGAEVASRAKDEFLAMLGHELRNPLAPIMTALQLMQMRGVDAAEKERAIIERQAKHLIQLVDDLLDVSRVAQGKIVLRKERVEISHIIAKGIETASPLLEERRHGLSVDVPPQGLEVDADPNRLAQVVANLLTNAAKYTEAGGQVRISAARREGDIHIEVRDNGIGISARMLPHVFDMFTQEPQTLDRSRGGLGLGLAIVRSLTALHGGAVGAHSEGLGKGSCFTIRIPVAGLAAANDSAPVQAPAAAALQPEGEALAILLVDDNADAVQLLGESLSSRGYRVCIATDGPSALKAVREFRPMVAILDIGLPGMDGYELAMRLREQPDLAALRLVALSGYGQDNDRRRSADAGFHTHIVKPVDMENLEMLLRGMAMPA